MKKKNYLLKIDHKMAKAGGRINVKNVVIT
jgi:hypothetical protein